MEADSAASNPVTPVNNRRNSSGWNRMSVDSWASSLSNDSVSMAPEFEWTAGQIQILCMTLDNLPSHLITPYVGSIPPQNILQKLARGVKDAKGPVDWPHSLRATRHMLYQLAAKRTLPPPMPSRASASNARHAPPVDATNSPQKDKTPASKVPLYRKNSMDDLLPAPTPGKGLKSTKENVAINKAATRLQQRTDRFFVFHPYANPRPRDSCALSSGSSDYGEFKHPLDGPATTSFRRSLRRSPSSTSSQLITVDETTVPEFTQRPHPASPPPSAFNRKLLASNNGLAVTHRTSNPCMPCVEREESGNRPLSMGPTVFADHEPAQPTSHIMGAAAGTGPAASTHSLKRAPSYGVVARQKKDKGKAGVVPDDSAMVLDNPAPNSQESPDAKRSSSPLYSSDEEERRRGKSAKRMKMLDRKPSFLGGELPFKDQPQTITVEEYTLSSMFAMPSLDSLPSLSNSSSVTQLSMRSIQTMKTQSTSKSSKSSKEKAKAAKEKAKTKPLPPLPPLPTAEVTERATSLSPPRTLRRVGNKPLRLEPILTSGLISPPPQRASVSTRPGLSTLGRKISFGSSGGEKSLPAQAGALLGAPVGLDSPFDEKHPQVTVVSKGPASRPKKREVKYLF
ncbi:hypothetical protein FRB99_006067 [Tulasnella sp. 403]|nr:hypothetical protein FRB99_006067 [Tulasnella sp. 403]